MTGTGLAIDMNMSKGLEQHSSQLWNGFRHVIDDEFRTQLEGLVIIELTHELWYKIWYQTNNELVNTLWIELRDC